MIKPLKTLKDKIEEKAVLQDQLDKVDDAIDEIAGETKVKIKKVSLKKAK